MRALTLHQPWASLIADHRKTCETRSWAPALDHVGQRLAIHAGRNMDDDAAREFYPHRKPGYLPRGAVVAVATLRCAFQVKGYQWDMRLARKIAMPGHVVGPWPKLRDYPDVDSFGDWSRGRWIWMLSDVKALPEPVTMRGWQGVWTMEPDKEQMVLEALKGATP